MRSGVSTGSSTCRQVDVWKELFQFADRIQFHNRSTRVAGNIWIPTGRSVRVLSMWRHLWTDRRTVCSCVAVFTARKLQSIESCIVQKLGRLVVRRCWLVLRRHQLCRMREEVMNLHDILTGSVRTAFCGNRRLQSNVDRRSDPASCFPRCIKSISTDALQLSNHSSFARKGIRNYFAALFRLLVETLAFRCKQSIYCEQNEADACNEMQTPGTVNMRECVTAAECC